MAEEQQKPVIEIKAQVKDSDPANPAAEPLKTETPAEVMIPKARFDEVNNALKKLQSDAAEQAKTQAANDEKKLAEQAEWQKLADKRKADVEALTPKAELADKLVDLVSAQYAAEIKDWPAEVKDMAPDDGADILVKLAWMSKAKPLAVAMMEDKAPTPGNGRRPKPIGTVTQPEPATQRRESDSMYSPF